MAPTLVRPQQADLAVAMLQANHLGIAAVDTRGQGLVQEETVAVGQDRAIGTETEIVAEDLERGIGAILILCEEQCGDMRAGEEFKCICNL